MTGLQNVDMDLIVSLRLAGKRHEAEQLMKKYREVHAKNKKNLMKELDRKEYKRRYYSKCYLGLCVYSSCRAPSGVHKYCEFHRDQMREAARVIRALQDSKGLCHAGRCPNPRVEGRVLCERHLALSRA